MITLTKEEVNGLLTYLQEARFKDVVQAIQFLSGKLQKLENKEPKKEPKKEVEKK